MSATESQSGLTTVFVDAKATKRRLKKAKLTVLDGPSKGQELEIDKELATIGRSLICDLVLSDKAVSGTHCELIAKEKGFLLKDLDSTNGTKIGELQLREVWLRPGTVFTVGQTRIRFDDLKGEVEIDLSKEDRYFDLVGKSVRMREIFAVLQKIAPTELTVLVRGETGTGKELVARAIHRGSQRADKPLVVQDCSAIPSNLIESTLFGHERGSFTGATDRHRGSFEQANGGTIFLDEIGELEMSLQPKLLRVLENREIKRVGGDKVIPVDVRVVAATNRDLRQMVNEGTFREDLYWRIKGAQVHLPPLRERPEDIPLLATHFLNQAASYCADGKPRRLTPEAEAALSRHTWPGNMRELRHEMQRASVLAGSSLLLAPSDFSFAQPSMSPTTSAHPTTLQEKVTLLERQEIAAALFRHDGNRTRAAADLGLSRQGLLNKIERYGLS